MKTYKQTLFISIISALLLLSGVSKVHAAGTVHFFLSGGSLVGSLQQFDYANNENLPDPDSEFGGGVLLDFIYNERHALAVDFYSFSEDYKYNPDFELQIDNLQILASDSTTEVQSLLIGYRHHFPSGFYLGGGILASDISNDYTISGNAGNVEIGFEDASPLALTLGYQTAFANGLSLGTHLLYSLPTDIEIDTLTVNVNTAGSGTAPVSDIELEDFSVQSLGFIIGYAWGGNS